MVYNIGIESREKNAPHPPQMLGFYDPPQIHRPIFVFDEDKPMLACCFILGMMPRIVMVSVNVQIENPRYCRTVRKKNPFSENIKDQFVSNTIPSVAQIPADTFLVMVPTNKPLFRMNILKLFMPIFIPPNTDIPEMNQNVPRLTCHHEVVDNLIFKPFRPAAIFLHLCMAEVGICDNPIIHMNPRPNALLVFKFRDSLCINQLNKISAPLMDNARKLPIVFRGEDTRRQSV